MPLPKFKSVTESNPSRDTTRQPDRGYPCTLGQRWRLVVSCLLLAIPVIATPALAQQRASDSSKREIATVLAHPLFDTYYACAEHAAGALPSLGDDLGQDCMVQAMDDKRTPAFMRAYRTDGATNEDWYGWNREVLSPCDCTVLKTHENPIVNVPGTTGTPPASFVFLKADDGTFFVLAHVQAILVKEGDHINAGQVIARVGNNGFARMPHIHVGAWRGPDGLQIRWDQKHMIDAAGGAASKEGNP